MTVLSTIHLGLQFGLQMFVAWLYGAGPSVDAYVAAITLPAILSAVLCGPIPSAFVPVFAEKSQIGRREVTDRLVTQTQLLVLGVMGIFSIGLFVAAEFWVGLFFPGFDEGQAQLSAELLRIVCWLTLLNSLTNFLYAVYQAHGEFTRPPLASVLGIVFTLVLLAFGGRSWSIHGMAWSVVSGTGLTVLLLSPRLIVGWQIGPIGENAGLKRVLGLLWPLVLAGIYFRVEPIVDRYLASGLNTGGVARLGYAYRVANALALLIPSGIIAVTFPTIALRAAERNWTALQSEISRSIRLLIVLTTPVIAAIVLFSTAIIQTLFEHGEFQPADTNVVATLLQAYCGLIVGFGLSEVFARVLHAMQDVKTPVFCSFMALAIGVGLKFWFVPQYGLTAIPWVTSVAMLLNTLFLASVVYSRFEKPQFGHGVLGTFVQSTIASTVACIFASIIGNPFTPVRTVAAAGLGGAIYLGVMTGLKNEFVVPFWQTLRNRIAR